jgi:site-specific DNA-adenine methylase
MSAAASKRESEIRPIQNSFEEQSRIYEKLKAGYDKLLNESEREVIAMVKDTYAQVREEFDQGWEGQHLKKALSDVCFMTLNRVCYVAPLMASEFERVPEVGP